MKNKVSSMLKQMLVALSAMAKSKSLALRRRTDALRTRLIIFSLLHHNKKFFFSTLSNKLQNHLSDHHHHKRDEDKLCEEAEDVDLAAGKPSESAMVSYCNSEALVHEPMPVPTHCEPAKEEEEEEEEGDDDNDKDEKYPDLRHTLFDDMEDPTSGGSVIELVKHAKEDRGEEFVLENEIDHVADLFIKRFHRQMRLQKLDSFKNYQEMLRRGA